MAIVSDFCHKMPVRCNPQKSAILLFTLFRPVANLWQKRLLPITAHGGYVDAFKQEFSS